MALPSEEADLVKRTLVQAPTGRVTIRDFDGWDAVQEKFFADGEIFDQIYAAP